VGKALSVDHVLSRLAEVTGLRFTASEHLRDHRMTVRWDRPAADGMADMARLWSLPGFPAGWRREARGKAGYLLHQDARAAQELERIRAADLVAIERTLGRLIQLAGRPEQPAKTGDPAFDFFRFSENQWRYNGRPFGRILGSLPHGVRAEILRGQPVSAPFEQWNPAARQALSDIWLIGDPDRPDLNDSVFRVDLQLLQREAKWSLGTARDRGNLRTRRSCAFASFGFSQGAPGGLTRGPALPWAAPPTGRVHPQG